MKIIPVNASRSYCVHIGDGLLTALGKEAAAVIKPGKAAIISDSNVWPLYGKEATKSLEKAGFETVNFVFACPCKACEYAFQKALRRD